MVGVILTLIPKDKKKLTSQEDNYGPLIKLVSTFFKSHTRKHILLLLVEAKNVNLNLGEKMKLSDEGAQLSLDSQVR